MPYPIRWSERKDGNAKFPGGVMPELSFVEQGKEDQGAVGKYSRHSKGVGWKTAAGCCWSTEGTIR